MTGLPKAVMLAVATLGVTAAMAAPAHAAVCVPIKADGVGQDNGDGTTTATITTHGLLLGTTSASFTITGSSGTTVSFAGPLTFVVSGRAGGGGGGAGLRRVWVWNQVRRAAGSQSWWPPSNTCTITAASRTYISSVRAGPIGPRSSG